MNAQPSQQEFTMKRAFAGDSIWFSGHFPGHPILPGIAQLSVVFDMIQQATEETYQVAALKRVKFKQIIHPDDTLEIKAVRNQEQPDSYSFLIRVKDEIACQGVMTLRSKR